MKIAGLIVSIVAATKFDQIVSFGDNWSDLGLSMTLTNNENPGLPFYEGRFSNGPVWIEYLAKEFNASLISYAVGMATSDNATYPAPNNLPIPGCIQQAQSLATGENAKDLGTIRAKPDSTLVSVSFFGNDFLTPGSTMPVMMNRLSRCLDTIVETTRAKHFLIPTTHNPALIPYVAGYSGFIRRRFTSLANQAHGKWVMTLNQLQLKYPDVTFYSYDFKDFLTKAIAKDSPYIDPEFEDTVGHCLTENALDSNVLDECARPDDYLFYDEFHLHTRAHKAMADSVKSLVDPAPST